MNLGNLLYRIVTVARNALFEQGELAELTYGAFDIAAKTLQASMEETVNVTYPVGYQPDRSTISSTRSYAKNELIQRYQFLAFHQLSVNSLVHLVTIVETMLGDVIRAVVVRYPQKLGNKRTISIQSVLESTSVQEIHLRATELLLNELSYKSPTDFAEQFQNLTSVNLFECPAFHRYIEMKACRDVFVHNRGIANETYCRKAGTHARATQGNRIHVDVQYFLESYEHCLQISDWLERQLHEHWHSSEYEERRSPQIQLPLNEAEVSLPTEDTNLPEADSGAG